MEKNYYGWGLPIDISTHGAGIDRLIWILHAAMIFLFIGWLVFLIYTLIRFRERPGHKAEYHPRHFKTPTLLEVIVAVFELVLLAAFSAPLWNHVRQDVPSPDKAFEVRVVAQQFIWNIHYPGKDRKFGKTSPELMNARNPVGLDPADLSGKDDVVTMNQLHIPVNTPILAHLTSKDVIHSFALTVMRIKQDVIPGQSIPVWFEANQTGNFEIACAQLCGLAHYKMRGFFVVETQADFDRWFAEQLGVPV